MAAQSQPISIETRLDMFSRMMGRKAVPERSPRVALPFAVVSVAAQYIPDLMPGFAENVLRIVRKPDSATRLIVECRTAALTIGALAMIGCLALKEAYETGILSTEDVEFARDLIVQTAIADFARDATRIRQFRILQLGGFVSPGFTLQEYELSLVLPILKGLGQALKQGISPDGLWIKQLGEMLDAANVSRTFVGSIMEYFWLDFQPMLISAQAEMVGSLARN